MIHITDGQTDRIVAVIDEEEFWEDKHTKSLKDTLETFDFTTFADKRFSEHLSERNRVIIHDEDGEYIESIIENTRKFHSADGFFVEVYTSASYIELAKAKVIEPQTTPAWTAKQHAEMALSDTKWEIGTVDFAGSRTITIESYTNPYSYLKQVANEFGLELHFRVETDSNKVTRRYVDLVERVGGWNGREVEFGKDLIGIERKEDFSNIVTALIGLGQEREDGTRLEVFVEDKDALARWGRNGQHIIEVYEPQSTDTEMTEERLRELTKNELEKRINSIVEYTADISDLEKVPGLEHEKFRFGDTIRIKDTAFNPPLYLEARIHTVERSIKRDGQKTVTLGDYIEYTEEEVMAIWKSLQAEIVKKVSMSDVTEVVYTKPEVDSKDAGVYRDSTYYADNVSETKKQEAIQVAAVDATNKANTAEQNAKNHTDTVAEQKKQEAIQQAVADAETKINTAKTELEADIAAKADAEWVNGQLQLKENAIHRGATAPTDTTKLWLDTSVVPNVLKRHDSATSSWVKATPTSAGEVGAYTKTEVDNALNSKVSVTQYNTDMNGVITRLDSAESRITQTENEIATKVSNTQYQQDKAALESDISLLETRMSSAETSITENANQIALKANKTDVYTKTEIDSQFSTVNQQISQLDAELSVQADQIATKVSQSTFNALENRVTQAESTITQTANNVTVAFNRIDSIDGVLNSAVTTIDASGVTVKDGSFYLEDDTSDTKYSIVPKINLIADHSFEMVEQTESVDLKYGDSAVKPQIESFGKWMTVGSPRLLSARQTDWVEFSLMYFGLQAIVVSSTDYVEQDFPYIPGKTYTVSAYFTGSTRSTSGVPRIDVRLEQSVTKEVKKTWTRSFSSVTLGQKLTRYSLTFTVPADADISLGGDIVMVSIRANSGWVVADGVQVVEGETPTLYDPENAVWELLYGRYEGRGFTGDYTIVGYGSNENGNFVRFGQGLQICWFKTEKNMAINNQYGALYQNSMKWTYPATFADIPSVCVGEARWGTGASWGTPTATEQLSTDIRVIDVVLRNSGPTRIKAIAIGRWK